MSKFDRNRIKDGWEKLCTNKQANKQTDTTKIMVTWPWTNYRQTSLPLWLRVWALFRVLLTKTVGTEIHGNGPPSLRYELRFRTKPNRDVYTHKLVRIASRFSDEDNTLWPHAVNRRQHTLAIFWVTVCKTVRRLLSDRCLSVCLSVCNVGILWHNGWMDQYATWCC